MNLTITQRTLVSMACDHLSRSLKGGMLPTRGMDAAYCAGELATLSELIQTADVVSITHHEDAGVPG